MMVIRLLCPLMVNCKKLSEQPRRRMSFACLLKSRDPLSNPLLRRRDLPSRVEEVDVVAGVPSVAVVVSVAGVLVVVIMASMVASPPTPTPSLEVQISPLTLLVKRPLTLLPVHLIPTLSVAALSEEDLSVVAVAVISVVACTTLLIMEAAPMLALDSRSTSTP
jgi:hypothetical protein